jgi:hypothetical protein
MAIGSVRPPRSSEGESRTKAMEKRAARKSVTW